MRDAAVSVSAIAYYLIEPSASTRRKRYSTVIGEAPVIFSGKEPSVGCDRSASSDVYPLGITPSNAQIETPSAMGIGGVWSPLDNYYLEGLQL